MIQLGLNSNFPYKQAVLGVSWAIYSFKTYLSWRQHVRLANPKLGVPLLLAEHVTAEEHEKAKAYGRAKSSFAFGLDLFNQLVATAMIVFDALPLMWGVSGTVLEAAGFTGSHEILQAVVFSSIWVLQSTILSIPFDYYKNFVVEEEFGFNKMTIPLFFSDKAKSLLLTVLLGSPLIAGGISVIEWGGQNFVFYAGAFVLVAQCALILLFPTVIAPLFNKFTPLEDGDLKTDINALAKSVDFPLTKLFVIDGSKRSSHSNAYFTGLFKDKRIVLFDTLLEQMERREILAVLAHELGHWKMSHIVRTLAVNQFNVLVTFYAFSYVSVFLQPLLRKLTVYSLDSSSTPLHYTTPLVSYTSQPTAIGFVLFSFLFEPIDFVSGFALMTLSRVHEFEADQYAKKLGYASELKSGLIKLNKKNLGNLIPDPWFSAWNYSHPPMVERLAAIGKTE
ncbi:peptidase family M48-domain-containing protein [Obelidium mucronatum]|nr:peptidase family M48-domain-containing protein [Obelidium mucronatum]